MISVAVIDASATSGRSFLHRASPLAKLAAFACVLLGVVLTWNALVVLGMSLTLLGVVAAARLPVRPVLGLAAYPAVFALIFAFAAAPDALTGAVIVLKAVTAALSAVIVVFTTPYPQVFAPIQRVTPTLVGDALLVTYRSLFLLIDESGDLLRAVRLRAGLSRGQPLRAVRATATALSGLLLYSFDLSERQWDVMRLRGYEGRLRVTLPRTDSPARDAAMIGAATALLAAGVAWRFWFAELNPYSWMPAAAGALALLAGLVARGRRA
ncbi:MAG: hypothetical protein IBX62_04620 [Coriobacteriia bacterium]|nr:hypothetical protein [Coriobacteriia bacterium]